MAFNFQSIKACTNCGMALVMFIMAINFYFNNNTQHSYSFYDQEEVIINSVPVEIKRDFKTVLEFLPYNIMSKLSYETAKQIHCMALNNYYEAASEGIEGMRAVSQVVMNRVDEKGFPSTACGVIYQKTNSTCQFSWNCQKTLPKLDTESDAWKNAVHAAKDLYVEGNSVRGLDNVLFYHADYVRPNWKQLIKVKQIGAHIFYKKKDSMV